MIYYRNVSAFFEKVGAIRRDVQIADIRGMGSLQDR